MAEVARRFAGSESPGEFLRMQLGAFSGGEEGVNDHAVVAWVQWNGQRGNVFSPEVSGSDVSMLSIGGTGQVLFFNRASKEGNVTVPEGEWVVVGGTKPKGTAVGTVFAYIPSLEEFLEEEVSEERSDQFPEEWTDIRIGGMQSAVGPLHADIKAIAAYQALLEGSQFKALAEAGELAEWLTLGGPPTAFYFFDQEVVTSEVSDLAGGGANQAERTGTTVIEAEAGIEFGKVETGYASSIERQKAVLGGLVKPGGLSTDYWFELWRDDWEAKGAASRTNECIEPLMEDAGVNWVTYSEAVKEVIETDLPLSMGGVNGNVLKVTTPAATSFAGVKLTSDLSLPKAGTAVVVGCFIRAASGKKIRMAVQEKNAEGAENPQHQLNFEAGGSWEWKTLAPGIEPDTEKINLLIRANNDSEVVAEVVLVVIEYEREAVFAESEAFPRSHEVASGQAVENEDGTYTMATPTSFPPTREGAAGEAQTASGVTETATELSNFTKYHVRLYMGNASGQFWGSDLTFTTKALEVRVMRESGFTIKAKRWIKLPNGELVNA